MYRVVRTDAEIDEQLNLTAEALEEGSRHPGMSYEEGIDAMFHWLAGDVEDKPL